MFSEEISILPTKQQKAEKGSRKFKNAKISFEETQKEGKKERKDISLFFISLGKSTHTTTHARAREVKKER